MHPGKTPAKERGPGQLEAELVPWTGLGTCLSPRAPSGKKILLSVGPRLQRWL